MDKTEIVLSMVTVFIEFISLTEIQNNEAYYRFVEYSDSHYSSQWSYRIDRELHLSADYRHIQSRYFNTLEELGLELFSSIENENGKRPIVCVISVTPDKNYNVKLSYEDPRALEIGKIGLGKENSFFNKNEIDPPQE